MKIVLVVLLALTAWASSSLAVEIQSKVVGCTLSHSDVEVPQGLLGEDNGSTYPVQIRTWPDDGSRSSVVNYNCFVRALVD